MRVLKKTIALYCFNVFGLSAFFLSLTFMLDLPLKHDTSMGLVSHKDFCLQILFCLVIEDLLFYTSHRILHTKWMYQHVHKVHHEYVVTISLAAVYTHPIEFVLGNLVPLVAGPMILGTHMHISTVFTWFAGRTFSTLDGHSGYEFSFSPFNMKQSDSGYHAYHHLHNIGNYGSFFIFWDSILGTNKAYFKFLKEQEKPQKAE